MKKNICIIFVLVLSAALFMTCSLEESPDMKWTKDGVEWYSYFTVGSGSGTENDPYILQNGTWANGSISYSGHEVWYGFNVSAGTTYYWWWNDSYDGNSTKNCDIEVLFHGTSGAADSGGYKDDGYNSGWWSTAAMDGMFKFKIRGFNNADTGSFGFVYSTSNTKPY